MVKVILVDGVDKRVSNLEYQRYQAFTALPDDTNACIGHSDPDTGYMCSRLLGHSGIHVAAGLPMTNQVFAVWGEDDEN